MFTVRNWYIYLVSAISLQSVTWAMIALSRNLLVFDLNPRSVAFQIAVIIIGLPFYLAHWLWGQRIANGAVDERGALLRRFYLYGSMAGFLGPWTANAFDLITRLLSSTNQYQSYEYEHLSAGKAAIFHLVAMIVLGALWYYHQRVAGEDARVIPETGASATVRRLYILGFSAAGLTLTTLTVIHLLRWVMLEIGSAPIRGNNLEVLLAHETARLIIGVSLWLIFWRWAQQLFDGPSEEERLSTLRKFYLYGAVLIGALGVVFNATIILAGVLRRLLDLAPQGDIRQPLPVIIGAAVLWAYHAFVLRDDMKRAEEAPRQAGVRRLYLYLIAAVGLAALLGGLSGTISVILRSLDESFGTGLRNEFAGFTAAIIAGLPVWIIPWRLAQTSAQAEGVGGADARRSVVRKIYLYFFLFIAIMTMLSSAVYIVFRILSTILGEPAPSLTELGHAIAFIVIAAALWLNHTAILRGDNRLAKIEQTDRLEALRVAVVNLGESRFGPALVDELKRTLPELSLDSILLTGDETTDQEAITVQLASAGLIIGSWQISIAGGMVSEQVAQAVVSSPARKLLIPFNAEGWDWAGVDRWNSEALVNQTMRAVKQILAGEEVKAHRPMSAGSVIGIIIGVIFLLILLLSAVSLLT